ncbi:MAG: lysylphosphatidylglycerol synthase transmembrane domain-containing protein [Kiritimatiellaeota bacterium]|nr:lysylphosphatidylglycerol synthase transmembrane domain-containing protein [Kiritimatiellota bacterium]
MAKKIISIIVSLGILAVIYHGLDWRAMVAVFSASHVGWLVAGLFLLVPTILLTSARLAIICPADIGLRFADALGLTLFAGVLNMVLPSKMGDVVKAAFIRTREARPSTLSLSLVVFEKALDVLSLLAWCCLGLFFYKQRDFLFMALTGLVAGLTLLTLVLLRSKHTGNLLNAVTARLPASKTRSRLCDIQSSWSTMQEAFWGHPSIWLRSLGISLLIWFLHLLQIWTFILALGYACPFLECMGLAALAIFAGFCPSPWLALARAMPPSFSYSRVICPRKRALRSGFCAHSDICCPPSPGCPPSIAIWGCCPAHGRRENPEQERCYELALRPAEGAACGTAVF